MVKTYVRVRLLTAPSSEFWVEVAVVADSVPMSSMGRCGRQEAGNRRSWKRVCGAGRGSQASNARIRVNNQDNLSP
jgi:hypothetical protein